MAKSFIEVNTGLLSEPSNNPTCFVTSKGSIRVKFVVKNPLATNDICAWWWRNKRLGAVVHEGVVFFLHGLAPRGITKSNKIIMRDRRRDCGSEIETVTRSRFPTGGKTSAMN